MLKNMKLGVKMLGGFIIVAAIVLALGVISWNGANQMNDAIDEIGIVRLPSVRSLLETELAVERLMVANRTLLSEFLDDDARAEQMTNADDAWNEVMASWDYFKSLPATDEEIRLSNEVDRELAASRTSIETWRSAVADFESTGVKDPTRLLALVRDARAETVLASNAVLESIALGQRRESSEILVADALSEWSAGYASPSAAGSGELVTLLRSYQGSRDSYASAVSGVSQQTDDLASGTESYRQVVVPARDAVLDVLDEIEAYAQRAGDLRDDLAAFTLGEIRAEVEGATDLIGQLTTINREVAAAEAETADELSDTIVAVIVVAMVAGFVLAIVLGLLLTRSITKPIRRGVTFAQEIARGNLDVELDIDQRDEIGELADSLRGMIEALRYKAEMIGRIAEGDFSVEVSVASQQDSLGKSMVTMVESLSDVISQVRDAAEQVSAGADQVSQASQDLSQGATESASSLEEISSSVNEISSQSRQNADNATEANKIAREASDNAGRGNDQMEQLREAMGSISGASDEIKKVVKVIDDIAFQINLLALNANVEAARAGKYGKGFAVVADEVRNLAVRSAEAVRETQTMVDTSVASIETGNGLTDQTATQLAEIVSGSMKVADFLEEIAAASKEQAQAIDQITEGLSQVDQVTQANTASAEESASAAEELASQAQQLNATIGRFRVAARQGADGGLLRLPRNAVGSAKQSEQTPRATAEVVGTRSNGNRHAHATAGDRPQEVIKLDDDEFGRF
ncbi:MAG: HAMP domain-containing methyl-accepting chemotaxis protein [Spirochaetota bacterium]